MSNIAYTAKDFASMRCNYALLKEGDNFLDVYPELKELPAFNITKVNELIPLDKAFRYVILVYDKKSPFTTSFPSQVKRKKEVIKYIKLVERGEVPENIQRMMLGYNPQVNEMIVAYGRLLYDTTWNRLCLLRDKNQQYEGIVRNATTFDNDLNKAMTAYVKEIDDLSDKILNNDNTQSVMQHLLRTIDSESISIFPEQIANLKETGENPLEYLNIQK